METMTLRAVLFKEEDWWVGQFLEHDIAAQAKTLKDLIYELQRTLVGHLMISKREGLQPFAHLQKAPERYFEMFKQGVLVQPDRAAFDTPADLSIPTPELRLVA